MSRHRVTPIRHRLAHVRPPRQQRGAALLLAMIIVTLVSTLAGAMVWQQWRAVQVEAAERSRAQSAWILNGALDWARLILREDARTGGSDHLGEPWAVPLAEARLSTFLAADANDVVTEGGPEAFLSGLIVDAQARYNVGNLIAGDAVVPEELAALQRLFDAIGVAPEYALRIAEGLRGSAASGAASAPVARANAPLAPRRLDQLAWFGVDAESLRRMADHVVILPRATPVNLNTAGREVLAAVVPGLDLSGAERLLQARQRTPFRTLAEAQALLTPGVVLTERRVGVASRYFEIRGRLRLDARVLEERTLVERRQLEIVPIATRRINSAEAFP